MHFFTAFPDAWLTGTATLTTEETGAFWNLCCYYIAKDGRVPDDARLLARVVKLSLRRWGLVRQTLLEGAFIEVRGGFIWQGKCEERLEKDGIFQRSQRDKAKQRWAANQAKQLAERDSHHAPAHTGADAPGYATTASATAEESQSNTSLFPEPPTSPHTSSPGRVNGCGLKDAADWFEEFWTTYPSRAPHPNPKKPAALKFAAIVKAGTSPDVIIAGAARYAKYAVSERTDPRYIPQATTWLNQARWTEPYELRVRSSHKTMAFEG